MRYRLSGRSGSTITRAFSHLHYHTNWLGYIPAYGIIFTFGVVQLPDHWYIDLARYVFSQVSFLLLIIGLSVVLRLWRSGGI